MLSSISILPYCILFYFTLSSIICIAFYSVATLLIIILGIYYSMVSRLFNKLLTNSYFISFPNANHHNIISKKVGYNIISSSTLLHNKSICSSIISRKLLTNAVNYQFSSSKLTQKQIQSSSYQELVDKLAKLYNFQQYKIPSALALLEIHHHYNIFKPGNWVLDIGAGPNWSWTQLALKLTHTPNMLQRVISCDIIHAERKQHPNNITVTGDFLQQPVRTKIALNLLNRQLDIILIDATKDYTGDQQIDAYQTLQVYIEALKFSQRYLKKGGTIILKTVQSSLSLKNENQSKFFFNQVYRYKSSAFRINSPAFFYVLKGYMMNDNLQGLQKFYNQYNKAKSTYSKVKIVEEYRSKYKWDPVQMVVNAAKQRVTELKGEGRKNKEIAAMYENDPFVKIGQILSLMQKIQDKKANPIQKSQARRELVLGKQQGLTQLPRSKEQFAEYLFAEAEKTEKEIEEQLKKKKLKSSGKRGKNLQTKQRIQQKAPLSDNQIYLKSTKVVESLSSINKQTQRTYFEQDLYGFYPLDPSRSIHLNVVKSQKQQRFQDKADLQKILKSFPEVRQAFERNKQQNSQQYKNFEEMFSEKQKKNETKAGKKEQKIKKQQIRNQFNDEEEDDDDQQNMQSQFSSTKFEQKVKNRIRNTRKAGESSEFDFDDSEAIEKQEEAELSRMERQQFAKDSKIQYLKSKPKKSNQKSQKSGQPSYFKMRNKNKGKDIF